MSSYYGWEAPTSLDFSSANCSLAALWLSSYLKSESDPSITTTYHYISTLVPTGTDKPGIGQATAWFEDLSLNSTVLSNMLNYPINKCPADVCEHLAWKGDADLAGVGVMVVYYLAAALASTFYIVLLIDQRFPPIRQKRWQRHWDWFASAFRESISTFVDVALIFSISMLVAGVYRHGSSRLHPDKTNSIYQLTNATYMSIFSVFPPLLLQLAALKLRRLRIRQFLWTIVIILTVAVTALYFTLVDSEKRLVALLNRESASTGLVWDVSCEPERLRDALDYIMEIADAFLGANFFWWVFYLLPPSFRTKIYETVARSEMQKRRWTRAIQAIKLLDGIVSATAMWTLLAVFTAYRAEVEDRMGESEDLEWSFGQVLSMATWAPVAIDLLTIYIYGAASGLEGKVSERFEVVESAADKPRRPVEQQNEEGAMAMDYRPPPQKSSSGHAPGYAKLGSATGYSSGY